MPGNGGIVREGGKDARETMAPLPDLRQGRLDRRRTIDGGH